MTAAAEQLLRWEERGGEWRVLSTSGGEVLVGLFTCHGEEMGRVTVSPDALADLLG